MNIHGSSSRFGFCLWTDSPSGFIICSTLQITPGSGASQRASASRRSSSVSGTLPCMPGWFFSQCQGTNGLVRTSSSMVLTGTARLDRALREKTRCVISSLWMIRG